MTHTPQHHPRMDRAAVKAIETRYAGCRFRSRLEARWAVFFDALGVTWEYEPEGFELPSGRYLPDFRIHLKKQDRWFEVKPPLAAGTLVGETATPPADPRWKELAQQGTPVLVAHGMSRLWIASNMGAMAEDECVIEAFNWDPGGRAPYLVGDPFAASDDPFYAEPEWVQDQPGWYYEGPDCGPAGEGGGDDNDFHPCMTCHGVQILQLARSKYAWCCENPRLDKARLKDAYAAAHGARFEFGANGRPR